MDLKKSLFKNRFYALLSCPIASVLYALNIVKGEIPVIKEFKYVVLATCALSAYVLFTFKPKPKPVLEETSQPIQKSYGEKKVVEEFMKRAPLPKGVEPTPKELK